MGQATPASWPPSWGSHVPTCPIIWRVCGVVVWWGATYQGRQVRYALADVHLARALRELVQIVLAVDPDQPCVEDDRAANATVEMRR